MSEPFIGEIRMWGFDWPPRNWARCDGAVMSINQNQTLYALLGTTYGGNGTTTFQLPDLRGRVPIHRSNSYQQGMSSGTEMVNLSLQNLPAHTHAFNAYEGAGDQYYNTGTGLLAKTTGNLTYASATSVTQLSSDTVSSVGGGQAHNNMQPYQVVSFCIALQGLFPPRN